MENSGTVFKLLTGPAVPSFSRTCGEHIPTWIDITFAGIILESPFTSMVDAGKSKYPILPIGLLLKDKYENFKKVQNINSPILIMHGEKDSIVPFFMGKKIYELANQPKFYYFSKYDDHMMEFNEKLLEELKKFINSLN